jgi:hypothetical protein
MPLISTDSRILKSPLRFKLADPPITHTGGLSRLTSALDSQSFVNKRGAHYSFKFGGYADDIIFLAVGSVIQALMVQNFEIISVFTTTSSTIDLGNRLITGNETDRTAGSLIITGASTDETMILTVVGTS